MLGYGAYNFDDKSADKLKTIPNDNTIALEFVQLPVFRGHAYYSITVRE